MKYLAFFLALIALSVAFKFSKKSRDPVRWPTYGFNLQNTRSPKDSSISSKTKSYDVKSFDLTSGHFSPTTPSISEKFIYTCEYQTAVKPSSGSLLVLSRKNLQLHMRVNISAITGVTGDHCRATPILTENKIIVGTQKGWLFALNRENGELLWKTQPNTHPWAVITSSGQYHKGFVYLGISSLEEAAAASPFYPCCSFRGSFHKINAETGAIAWTWWAIDESLPVGPGNYSGVGIWGSTPSISVKHNSVYLATGNPYEVPNSVEVCHMNNPSDPNCVPEGVHFNAIVSLNLDTGNANWVRRKSDYDAWNVACIFKGPNCPASAGPDADFGMAPALVENLPQKAVDRVIVGQKSGVVWCLNAITGEQIWATKGGPGGILGGASWGATTDGKRYVSTQINGGQDPWTLKTNETIVTGFWSSMDVLTGEIEWETQNPHGKSQNAIEIAGATATGPGTIVNDVVVVGSADQVGSVYVLRKSNGEVLYSYNTGATIYGGASVYENCFYIGNGYPAVFSPTFTSTNTKIYSFCAKK